MKFSGAKYLFIVKLIQTYKLQSEKGCLRQKVDIFQPKQSQLHVEKTKSRRLL